MNFNIFSKEEEAAIPAESTVTLTVHLTDGAQISAVDKVYSLDEYEKSKEESRQIIKKIYDDIENGKSLIHAWKGCILFKAEDFKRALVTGINNFKQNE
jgi:hypothetical protein